MKTLLKNGRIYDGTGKEAFSGNILVEDERILGVNVPEDAEVDRVVDLQGKSVAPGFIDMHSHNDWFAIKKDPLPYFEPFIRQGITTFVAGNCGVSTIGFEKDTKHMAQLGSGLFFFKDTTGEYEDFNSFAQVVDGNMPCNMAVLVGHCTARASVAGYENRRLTEEEEERMLALLERELQNGAAGISLGLMYEPGLYADSSELKKVVDLCLKYDKPLTVHPRAESKVSMAYPQLLGRSHLLRAFDELMELSKGTPLKLQYSHAIFVGRRTLPDKAEFLKLFRELRESGTDVMFDIYNELQGVSVITVILPVWYQGMSPEERRKPLNRLKLRVLVAATSKLLGFGFEDIQIAYIGPGYEQYEGKTVHELAQKYHKSDLDMYLELCEKSNFQGRVNMGPYTTPEIIHDFEHNPLCLYMTDAWVEDQGVQNPVLYNCFPKFIRDSVTGVGDTLPATIRRMTGASADRFGLKDRGYIRPGCYADLTVFDEEAMAKASAETKESFGIEKVYINGTCVLDGDKLEVDKLKKTGQVVRV